ncbi:MAG: hypothetical protein IPN23_07740 [Elusimicrobia bacterium]|nr:hypothetical protein [Elusimicrobiota bacterium]
MISHGGYHRDRARHRVSGAAVVTFGRRRSPTTEATRHHLRVMERVFGEHGRLTGLDEKPPTRAQ